MAWSKQKKVDGINYRSIFEADIAENSTVKFEYEKTVIEYVMPPKKYKPDFTFKKKAGGLMIIEGKGYFTSSDRTKMKLVKDQNPTLDIRFLFQNANNKLRRGSKTTYAKWAESNGFPWAEGINLPKEWVKEIKK